MNEKADTNKTIDTHHPSCRESDKNLVWHCGQCGLNESAADIEQKADTWRQAHDRLMEENLALKQQLAAERSATLFCDVHGTELQREACNHVRTCEQCLAAERELRERDRKEFARKWDEIANRESLASEQLRQQLAAERELRKRWERKTRETLKQLAAEREKVKDAQEEAFDAYAEADAIREQLAAERKKTESL